MPPKTAKDWSIYISSMKEKDITSFINRRATEERFEVVRIQTSQVRSSQTNEQRESRLETDRLCITQPRSSDTGEQRESRLEVDRVRPAQARLNETIDQRRTRLGTNRERNVRSIWTFHADFKLAAFHSDADYDYSLHLSVVIGKMDRLFELFCRAWN